MSKHVYLFIYLFQVNQRNVPGIDNAYLAMDTEEGVEVVWNEVMFSERKNFKLQEVRPARQEITPMCVGEGLFLIPPTFPLLYTSAPPLTI